jgi:microcystin-dependent protein
MSDQFLGEIRMVGFNFAPVGWLLCNGQLLAINQYAALFALLGTQYGGNGTSTFGVPNLQGRAAIHQGTGGGGTYVMGEIGGNSNVTLTSNQMPIHTHPVNALSTNAGAVNTASGNVPCTPLVTVSGPGTLPHVAVAPYSPNTPDIQMSNRMIGTAGGSTPVATMPPFQVVNFIIATVGLFPSRN